MTESVPSIAEAQAALDEPGRAVPFQTVVSVYQFPALPGHYDVHFRKGPALTVPWLAGESFKDAVRAAITRYLSPDSSALLAEHQPDAKD